MSRTSPLCFVLPGPRRPGSYLPLPRRQQLLRPHHPGLRDDVAPRSFGGGGFLRAAEEVPAPSFPPAALQGAVPREAAGLGGKSPGLGVTGEAQGWCAESEELNGKKSERGQ